MTARQFLTNTAIILTVMAVAALLETGVPFLAVGARTGRRRAVNLALTAVVFLVNWGLGSLAALVALALSIPATSVLGGLPRAVQIVAGVLVLDFSIGYLSHRMLHVWPALWRFHQVHHSDDFVDVTTTYRTHPVETVWRFLFAIVPVWVIGIAPAAVVIQRLLQATNGVIAHANIRLWAPLDRVLSGIWVTPNVHKIHHSRQLTETNSNYGTILTIYDRVLRTYTPAARANAVIYGLGDADRLHSASLPHLLSLPFRNADIAGQTGSHSGPVQQP